MGYRLYSRAGWPPLHHTAHRAQGIYTAAVAFRTAGRQARKIGHGSPTRDLVTRLPNRLPLFLPFSPRRKHKHPSLLVLDCIYIRYTYIYKVDSL
jgi:hypothetical protein